MTERPSNLFTAGSSRPRNPPSELNLGTFNGRQPPSFSSTSSGSASSNLSTSSASSSSSHNLVQRFCAPPQPAPVVAPVAVPAPTTNNQERTRERIKQQACGKLLIDEEFYHFTSDDLTDVGEIGRGAFGTVNKMIFKVGKVMAVKRIRSTVDEKEQKQLLMDLEVVMNSNECPYIVQFYGALFKEGDCWICMELMDTSLDKFYKYIYERKQQRIPESILTKITVATVQALNYLKEELSIIHRDVNPAIYCCIVAAILSYVISVFAVN
ncbi:unnamed protein product [Ceratitis capitata]|uniref:mitogen-activated protein kinase kinase n=1 Tax=Ceratitis capitata TaxID=7213 RepID=A0A811U1I2_CERCA|nr:unnamed protein product [Ceratitis capitata]